MDKKKKYLTAKAKTSMVLELLRGEDIELLSRRHKVTVAQLSAWRDSFIEGGEQGFRKKTDAAALKLGRAERLIGKLQMELELRKKKGEAVRRLNGK